MAPRNDRRIIHSRGGDDSPSPEWWVPDGPFAILASYVLMSGAPFVGRGTPRPAVNNPWMGVGSGSIGDGLVLRFSIGVVVRVYFSIISF